MIKPYDSCASKVEALLPHESCAVIFLEEEIRSGGMGMNLSEKLSSRSIMLNKKIRIVATDDSFVTDRKQGETIHCSAKVDSESICQAIKEII